MNRTTPDVAPTVYATASTSPGKTQTARLVELPAELDNVTAVTALVNPAHPCVIVTVPVVALALNTSTLFSRTGRDERLYVLVPPGAATTHRTGSTARTTAANPTATNSPASTPMNFFIFTPASSQP